MLSFVRLDRSTQPSVSRRKRARAGPCVSSAAADIADDDFVGAVGASALDFLVIRDRGAALGFLVALGGALYLRALGAMVATIKRVQG